MNQEERDLAVRLANKEITILRAEIERLKAFVRSLQGETVESPTVTGKRGRRTSDATQALLEKVKGVLASSEESLTPKQVKEKLDATGFPIDTPTIRGILNRFKGEIFDSPEYSKWQLLKT